MATATKHIRTPWQDRFRKPSVDDLRDHYNKQLGGLLDAAREALCSGTRVHEEIAWQGLPWRWTLTYRCEGSRGPVWAYLVPDPQRPILVMPLTRELVGTLPMTRLKKHIRDAIISSRLVSGIHWATWELTSKSQLAEVLEIVERARASVPSASRN